MSSPYPQEAAVAAISDFYEAVNRAHLDAKLEHPPSEGWVEITPELFRPMRKSKAVIDLLRHIPYFTDGEALFIMPHTNCLNYIDYNILRGLESAKNSQPEEEQEDVNEGASSPGHVPSHIVAIATANGRYGFDTYIDVERGAVIWHSMDGIYPGDMEQGDLEPLDDPDDDEAGEEYREAGEQDPTEWRRAPTFRIETFFRLCKEKFENGEWVAIREGVSKGTVREGEK